MGRNNIVVLVLLATLIMFPSFIDGGEFAFETDQETNRVAAFETLLDDLNNSSLSNATKQSMIDSFVTEQMDYGFPILFNDTVYWFYQNVTANDVIVHGYYQGYYGNPVMTKIDGTDTFYHKSVLPPDTRLPYVYIVDSQFYYADPLNPDQTLIPNFNEYHNTLYMPGYEDDGSYLFDQDVGSQVIESQFVSNITTHGWNRSYTVYLPPGYDESTESYPVMYTIDGRYITEMKGDRMLDYYITNEILDPMILVTIDSIATTTIGFNNTGWSPILTWWIQEFHNANGGCDVEIDPINYPGKDGICQQNFADLVVTELVPLIDSTYRTIKTGASRGITGISSGSSISSYIMMKHPAVFRLGGLPSWEFGFLDFVNSSINGDDGYRFFLNTAVFDSNIEENINMTQLMYEKSIPVKFTTLNSWHGFDAIQQYFGEMLVFLFGDEASDYRGAPLTNYVPTDPPLPSTTNPPPSTPTSTEPTSLVTVIGSGLSLLVVLPLINRTKRIGKRN